MKLVVYTDGASRGNPGHSSYGFIILDDKGELIHQENKYIGKTTNNVAEYNAVLEALKFIEKKFKKHFPLQINLNTDSKLLSEQLMGHYKIKNPNLRKLFDQIKLLEIELGVIFYHHIRRHLNTLADRLANEALDKKLKLKTGNF